MKFSIYGYLAFFSLFFLINCGPSEKSNPKNQTAVSGDTLTDQPGPKNQTTRQIGDPEVKKIYL